MLKKLWLDEGGAVLSVELILLLVIVVIGISVGMVVLRDAVVTELQVVAAAVNSIDAGYAWSGLAYAGTASSATVDGSQYINADPATPGSGVINNVVAGITDLVLLDLTPGAIPTSP